ncbi:tubulin-folding cofactor B [Syngnathoides biaculeatus]|uniref:tubulin-folding cofactor B n=1 Tax=Syngnathoides biaculeatus TaxID=300417 RepID=UPI002ADE81DA|nr:tubulin-folding cofactor B [Syngnathoides biaculeatus]XP_061682408.1 tubulin-folding cofactor B [Syngnathoides biaculeatus]XP_061682409.1 tubulin-folding cofactor B [Syngnathoides biaculeatus]XP_061682410.1 tubulin-folding cofactor B [Syngnathoides biaculeatus]
MDGSISVVTNPSVNVRLTTTISSFEVKRRFDRGITIAELKGKLEMVVGAPASNMDLELYSTSDKLLQKLDDDNALLGSYPVDDDCRIHVIDQSGGQLGEFTDVSKVEKFVLSDEAYEKRSESARSFMKKQCLGRYNEEEWAKKKANSIAREEEQKAAADAISVGSRCQVQVPGQPTKLGTVMYVGTTDFKPGHWVGVKYDEPLGKNDGSCAGKRYFECEKNYGVFVKPLNVTVGDFPEEDYGLDEM